MKHAWIIILFGLALEFYIMTEPSFLFPDEIIEEPVEEEIIFEQIDPETIHDKVNILLEKEIKLSNKIIKFYHSENKYFFEFVYDENSNIDWDEKNKSYELYLEMDCAIFLVDPNNPERIIKTYD